MQREIKKIHVDPDTPIESMLKVPGGNLYFWGPCINSPEAFIAMEDFGPGSTVEWQFWHNEVHYILRGKAEVTYRLPPFYLEEKTMTVEQGDSYFIPNGARLRWKVSSEGPLRKYTVMMPGRPEYFEEIAIEPKQFKRTSRYE